MNILFIIGNGFDLNLGLKTGYRDFYKNYLKIDSSSENIKNLKSQIKDDIVNWSDLELALGKYTENLNSLKELDEIIDDLTNSLADYLEKQETEFNFEKLSKSLLYRSLSNPESFLPTADQISLQNFMTDVGGNNTCYVDIITFNYTNSLEKILENNNQNISIGATKTKFVNNVVLKNIFHIHGRTTDNMVLGVNDITQIAKTSFHKNKDILEVMVKSYCNKANKHMIDETCKKIIKNSHLICIFGSSLGDTDNLWWDLIIQTLENRQKDCRAIIYSRDSTLNPRQNYKRERVARKIKADFINKRSAINTKIDISDNIFVGFNTGLFNLAHND